MGANASAWSTTNSFQQQQAQQQQPQSQVHLYDVGNQQQKLAAAQFSLPQNLPQVQQCSTTGGGPRCAIASSSNAAPNGGGSTRVQQRQHQAAVEQSSTGVTTTSGSSSSDFFKIGAVWLDRYEITEIKGKGTFGQVFRAHDRITHEEVAIKVIKNRRQFLAQAEIEIKLLREIAHFQANDQIAAEVGANYVGELFRFLFHTSSDIRKH